MTGATASARSHVDDFGRLVVNYRGAAASDQRVAEGRYWELFYQLADRATSRDEILSNYESEARRLGGEVFNRSSTRLVFRLTQPGGGVIWCRLDAHAGGAYELEIIDEAGLRLEIQGHTDSTGSAERNRVLSQERADAVVSALRLYGVDADRLGARGLGPDQPIGDNSTDEGRQQNRRVELVRLP